MPSDWKELAAAKRESVNNLIPSEWRISVSSQEDPRDITGKYLHQYLSPKEVEITEADAVNIAEHTTTGVRLPQLYLSIKLTRIDRSSAMDSSGRRQGILSPGRLGSSTG